MSITSSHELHEIGSQVVIHLTTQGSEVPRRSRAGSPGDRSAHPKIARPTPSSPRKRPRLSLLGCASSGAPAKRQRDNVTLQPNAWRVRGTLKPKPVLLCAVFASACAKVVDGSYAFQFLHLKYFYLLLARGLLSCPAALTFFVCWVL